jgi:hypothetical protein
MVCIAATDHLREENWWGESSNIEKETDDMQTLKSNESDAKRDCKGIKPHKAVFHAERCADCNHGGLFTMGNLITGLFSRLFWVTAMVTHGSEL